MTSPSAIKNARTSVAKVATIIIVSHILQNELFKNPIFTSSWLYLAISQLIGWVTYDLFIANKHNFKHPNVRIAACMNTVFKMGTIFTISQISGTGMNGKINLNKEWALKTLKTLVGFAVVELGADFLPKWKGHKGTVKDMAFVIASSIAPVLIDEGKIDKNFWMQTGTVMAGFFVFDEYLQGKIF